MYVGSNLKQTPNKDNICCWYKKKFYFLSILLFLSSSIDLIGRSLRKPITFQYFWQSIIIITYSSKSIFDKCKFETLSDLTKRWSELVECDNIIIINRYYILVIWKFFLTNHCLKNKNNLDLTLYRLIGIRSILY